MAPRPHPFAEYCCELLSTVGPCEARRMFGGFGLRIDGLTIGILADLGQGERLWLKAGPDTRSVFEAAGCERFTYQAKGKEHSMGYYSVPDEAMAPWARLALDAALAARQAKPKAARKR